LAAQLNNPYGVGVAGLNALGGGPDSRALPMAQPVEEVAEVMLDLIRNPRAEVYTRPMLKDQVIAYFSADDIAAAEAAMPRPQAAKAR